ncbi:MAG: hypothetical protein QW561_04285, partial [Candidatus Aenigmatarchaeota archaeon]
MFEINLVRAIKKEPERAAQLTFKPIFISLCLLFILELFFFYYLRINLLSRISSLTAEIMEYEKKVSILDENLNRMKTLKGALDGLIAEKDDWWEKLSAIGKEIPSNLWLSSIRTETKVGKGTSDHVKVLY